MRNQGSILTRVAISVLSRVKTNRNRMAVIRIDIELLLNSELKKNVNPRDCNHVE